MIPSRVAITGKGQVKDITPGWSVVEEATPVAPGDTSGGVGAASIRMQQDKDAEFIIDESAQLSVDGLGEYFGTITTATSEGATTATETVIPFSLDSKISSLTAVKSAQIIAGPYNIVEAGRLRQGGEGTFQPEGFDPGLTSSDETNFYRLDRNPYTGVPIIVQVSPSGVRTEIPITGGPAGIPDIYGFAAQSPTAFIMFYSVAGVFKLGFFNRSTGALINSVGSNGSGPGQFGSSALFSNVIYWSPVNSNVYVVDVGNNRVQRFDMGGTYLGQWATPLSSGLIAGNQDSIYVKTGTVISSYSLTGTLTGAQSPPVPNPDAMITSSDGEALIFSGSGTLWLVDKTTGSTFSTVITGYATSRYLTSNKSFIYVSVQESITPPYNYHVQMFAAATSTLYTAFAYYANLGGVNSISYEASSNPVIPLPPWKDSVWTKIKELSSAYNVEVAVVNDVMTVRDVGTRILSLDRAVGGSVSLKLSSQQTAQYFKIRYSNTSPQTIGVVYDAAADNKFIEFSAGTPTSVSLVSKNTPAFVYQPTFAVIGGGTVGPGGFGMSDSTGRMITPTEFYENGGTLNVSISPDDPNTLILDVFLLSVIPNTVGNYRFIHSGNPVFSVIGVGLFSDPGYVDFMTAANPVTTSTINAGDINNPFIDTLPQLYERSIWRSAQLSGPEMTLSADIPTSELDGFGLTAGSIVEFKESRYRVKSVSIGAGTTRITATRHVTVGQLDANWSGKTVGQVDAFWSGYKLKDLAIKPLRSIT